MSEQAVKDLLSYTTYIEPYTGFAEAGVYELAENSVYFTINLIYQCISPLFRVYNLNSSEVGYQKLISIKNNDPEVIKNLPNINNKLVLAKLAYFNSNFILTENDQKKDSVFQFKLSAEYFCDFIIGNSLPEIASYELIQSLVNLLKHPFYNQLDKSLKINLDICIDKLYKFNKICYLNLCQRSKIINNDKISKLLHPLLNNFDVEIQTLDLFFILVLIDTYFTIFNLNVNHLNQIKNGLNGFNPTAYQMLKNICSKFPNTTIGIEELKEDVENMIDKCQKEWFEKIKTAKPLYSDGIYEEQEKLELNMQEYENEIRQGLEGKNTLEKLNYLISAFNESLNYNSNFNFNLITFDAKTELLANSGIMDILGFGDTCFKPGVMDKQLTGDESLKQKIIESYISILLSTSKVIFNLLVESIETDSDIKGYILGLIDECKFFEHRKEEIIISSKMIFCNRELIYASSYIALSSLEFCFQRNIEAIGGVSSTQKKGSAFSRHPRYLTDIVNNQAEMIALGFEPYEMCLLKVFFSNSNETQAGFNIRNDLLHGSIPINEISISISKFLFLFILNMAYKRQASL